MKRLARWILRNETNDKIRRLENDVKMYKDSAEVLGKECKTQSSTITQKTNELSMLQTNYDALKRKCTELESQNAILRQYYHLDEEPSQETIDKMYLDEKYREQEKELTQLRFYKESYERITMTALFSAWRPYPYVPYPVYQCRLY